MASQVELVVENLPANARILRDVGSIPVLGRSPGEGNGTLLQYSFFFLHTHNATPVFLPGKFHGERSLVGYRPWGYKESDTTEHLSTYIE